MTKSSSGFTLIELLVVIAIIGVLSSIVLSSLVQVREKADVAKAVTEVRSLQTAIELYNTDVGTPPVANCSLSACTASNDPMLNSLGARGWAGPYSPHFYDFADPWGGQYSFHRVDDAGNPDWDGDGRRDYGIRMNDDRPGTNSSDNGGPIPLSAAIAIDKILDDGNLSTGNVRGNGASFGPNMYCSIGELCIWFGNY
ncbi:MAG TPA: type II secretion system protein [Candidatus Paceibacterota bacterium]|jgi:general secretion pathway protein G|nr:type II secretion system protein [Candidatus Paceibacterota bacterium]